MRGLTPRSTRGPAAGHLARDAPWFIMRLAGPAPHRRARVTSNVRPHKRHLSSHERLPEVPPRPRPRRTTSLVRNALVASHMQGVWRALSSSTNEKRSCVRACLLSVWPCSVCSVTEHGGCGNLHPGLRGHLPCSTRHCSPRSGAGVMNSSAECKHRSRGSGALLRHTAVNAQTQQACVSALWVRPNTSVNARPNGIALGPQVARCHHPPRGPSAIPSVPRYLER